ncbi:hypothetical protein [Streptomyces sp. NPDC002952]|uniref:hypothetical protein n=1 Tax=Streptomyces sp. NPDC002952 TaxID=3364673 RepID=UPI0036B3017E
MTGTVMLVVGDQQLVVQADLGVLRPDPEASWGGILRNVPTRLLIDLHVYDDIRLRLPDGQERFIRPLDGIHAEDTDFTPLYFAGEGTPPL